MNPTVFQLAVSADGIAKDGDGLLAVFIPAGAGNPPLVVVGNDPRHESGQPIEGTAGAALLHIDRALGMVDGIRWVIVDNAGQFFEAIPHWSQDQSTAPLLEFKRFTEGAGIDGFARTFGASAEAALQLLSTVVEGRIPEAIPANGQQFLEAIEHHGNLPSPGSVFRLVQEAYTSGDISGAVRGIQTDPMISASLVHYANAAAYAHAGKTASVLAAVQRLGMNHVRRIVFIADMMNRYQHGICAEFDYRGYWFNAVATGAAMRGLCNEFDIPASQADDAFTTGLVSGIGWLATAETFPHLVGDYARLSTGLDSNAKARLQQELFPAPITEVTTTYLARFEFPELTRSAISGAANLENWAWFDCLAKAVRVAQALSPLDLYAIPDTIAAPEECLQEWRNWQGLLALSS